MKVLNQKYGVSVPNTMHHQIDPRCPKLNVSRMSAKNQRHFKNAAAKIEFYNRLAKQYATDAEMDTAPKASPDMRRLEIWSQLFGSKERWREVADHAMEGLTRNVPIKFGFTRHTHTSVKQIEAMKEHKRERENARRLTQPKPKWHPTRAELAAA